MTCQWQTGLLVMRECGAPAAGACAGCGRLICVAHGLGGSLGLACPACAATRSDYPQNEDTEMAGHRQEFFGSGPQFGQAGYFSPTDAAALNAVPQRRPEYDPHET